MSTKSWIDDLVPGQPKRPASRKNILVADDDPVFVSLVQSALSDLADTLIVANNGADALEQLLRNPCDLAIVDLCMPEIDGFRLIAYIRQLPTISDLPIAVVTVREDTAAAEECRRLGVQLFLTKPVNWNAFPYQIDHVLLESERRHLANAGPVDAPSVKNQVGAR